MRSLFLPLLFSCFSIGAFSQANPRHLEEVTYDSDRNLLLVFGGAELNNEQWSEPAMVHEWDGSKWNERKVTGPLGRRGHGWVYNGAEKQAVLIGGVMTGVILKDSVVFDVWTWNGDKWKKSGTHCPVKEPEAVYDPVGKRILVYGDAANKSTLNYNIPASFELWEYKNDVWNKISADGPDIRGARMIAFDIARQKLVVPVYEENGMTIWEWMNNEWKQISLKDNYPAYRTRFALAYDKNEKATILFGGLSAERKQMGDCWAWDGKQWTEIKTGESPSVRNSAHFTSDNNQLFLYGGSVSKPVPQEGIETCNELWSLKNGKWRKVKY